MKLNISSSNQDQQFNTTALYNDSSGNNNNEDAFQMPSILLPAIVDPFYRQEDIDAGTVQPLIPLFPMVQGDPFPHNHYEHPIPNYKRSHLLPSIIVKEERNDYISLADEFFGEEGITDISTAPPFCMQDFSGSENESFNREADTMPVPFFAAQAVRDCGTVNNDDVASLNEVELKQYQAAETIRIRCTKAAAAIVELQDEDIIESTPAEHFLCVFPKAAPLPDFSSSK